MEKYDILVVGGSTTGSWFARKMAEKGYKVLMIEKEDKKNISRAYDIFHMSKKEMEQFGLEIPEEVKESVIPMKGVSGIYNIIDYENDRLYINSYQLVHNHIETDEEKRELQEIKMLNYNIEIMQKFAYF